MITVRHLAFTIFTRVLNRGSSSGSTPARWSFNAANIAKWHHSWRPCETWCTFMICSHSSSHPDSSISDNIRHSPRRDIRVLDLPGRSATAAQGLAPSLLAFGATGRLEALVTSVKERTCFWNQNIGLSKTCFRSVFRWFFRNWILLNTFSSSVSSVIRYKDLLGSGDSVSVRQLEALGMPGRLQAQLINLLATGCTMLHLPPTGLLVCTCQGLLLTVPGCLEPVIGLVDTGASHTARNLTLWGHHSRHSQDTVLRCS